MAYPNKPLFAGDTSGVPSRNFVDRHSPSPLSSSVNGSSRRRICIFNIQPLALLLPLGLSIALFVLSLHGYKTTGWLYETAKSNRTMVQFVVHTVAATVGFLWTYSICTSFQRCASQVLMRQEVSLDTLRLWTTLSTATPNFQVAWRKNIWVVLFIALTGLPAALWSASLTPQTTIDDSHSMELAIPKTGLGSYPNMWLTHEDDLFESCWQTPRIQPNGSFTNCPAFTYGTSLLLSGSSASTVDGSLRSHTKYDHTKFKYLGRSYGAGTSVGLSGRGDPFSRGFSFHEVGYLTKVNCIRNASSQWILESISGGQYMAIGYFPNSNWSLAEKGPREDPGPAPGRDYINQLAFIDPNNITTFGASRTGINFRQLSDYYVAIAAGSSYANLNRLQCQLEFEPTTFLVDVSLLNNTITVHPQGPAVTDPEPTGYLRWAVQRNFNAISQTVATPYKSAVGDSLTTNIANRMMAEAHSRDVVDPKTASNAIVYEAVAEAVAAITDDVFAIFAAATLTEPAAYTYTHARVTREAVQLGSRGFIIANLILNAAGAFLVFVLAVGEFVGRRRSASCETARAAMPFDYTDVASVAVGVAVGITTQEEERPDAGEWLVRATATSNSSGEGSIGAIRARLENVDKDRLGIRLRANDRSCHPPPSTGSINTPPRV